MLIYNIDKRVEAFSTLISDSLEFDATLPLHQAHGTECRIINGCTSASDLQGVDALITQQPGLRIGVKTADCVPILLFDPSSASVAAIHSGWKGTLAAIATSVIGRMAADLCAKPQFMKAVIGPCIHLDAFEVGDELYEAFTEKGYADFCQRLPQFGSSFNEKWHIDLPAICRIQLQQAGIKEIEVRPECTYTLHRQFYSARRLGPAFSQQRILNCIKLL